jgi:hypothetical protein
MAQLIGDLSQNTMGNFTVLPKSVTANETGIAVPTASLGGDVLTLRFAVGQVTSLTSAICYAESSADGSTGWTTITGANGVTANVTITAANTTGAVAFFPANGTLSQYVRGNVVLTGTSANITALVEGQLRIGTGTGYVNTPYSGAQ